MASKDHLQHSQLASSDGVQRLPADEAQESTKTLCHVCRGLNFLRRFAHPPAEATIPEVSGEYPLGSVEDVRRRNSCTFCRFVGRLIQPDIPSGKKVHFFLPHVLASDVHVPAFSLWLLAGGRLQRDVKCLHGVSGRGDETIWPVIEPARICSVLRRCERDHDHFRLKDNRLYNTPLTITLIDVVESKLVTRCSRDRYLALSYVWGNVSMFQTTKSSRPSLGEPGALTKLKKDIPRLIRDSMSLVLAMGERYLWVDSLV